MESVFFFRRSITGLTFVNLKFGTTLHATVHLLTQLSIYEQKTKTFFIKENSITPEKCVFKYADQNRKYHLHRYDGHLPSYLLETTVYKRKREQVRYTNHLQNSSTHTSNYTTIIFVIAWPKSTFRKTAV